MSEFTQCAMVQRCWSEYFLSTLL